ncbi:MAG: endo-1,4-beta-xylanase [Clostridia bacterium]|nr:endo-1,4-beta-xylanase [Clostridia bacterium]
MKRRDIALKYFDENENFMQTIVADNIEKHRKGDMNIILTDKDGNALGGAKIKVTQKTHEFKYGANIFMLDEMENDEKNEEYKKSFKKIFNLATIPFYWSYLEPEKDKPRYAVDSPKIYRRPPTDLCVNFCFENGIEPKCHCLNYDNYIPDWLDGNDIDAHKAALEKRFAELSERYADVIPSWEVTNETLEGVKYPYNAKPVPRSSFYFEDDFVEWSFRLADKYFPNNRLIINEYLIFNERDFNENRSMYYMQIERLIKNGITHLDSIGMQYHSFFSKEDEERFACMRYDPAYLYRVLDRYAKLGKNIQMTEITIPAYSNSAEDEAVQAELIEKIYTVFFSHPAMEAIIYWNLPDGYAAFAPQGDMTAGENKYYAGLLRFDLSKKPAYHVIDEMFNKRYRTNTEICTDSLGRAALRGFYGDYELEITLNGKKYTRELTLSKNLTSDFDIVI